MRTEWLIDEGHSSIIVFCSGWAMDSQPFLPLVSEKHDVMVCYDYRDGKGAETVERMLEKYKRAVLVAWSMGVYYAQKYLGELSGCFEKRIAVNGTLCPVDNHHGIPEEVFRATLEGLNDENLKRFFRRMHKPGGNLKLFLENKPRRKLEDQREELRMMLEDTIGMNENRSIYTNAVVSKNDFIFPTENQYRFWQRTPVSTVPGCHFPFYRFSKWDDIPGIPLCNDNE